MGEKQSRERQFVWLLEKAAKCIFLLHSSYGSSSLFGICGPFGFELGFNRV